MFQSIAYDMAIFPSIDTANQERAGSARHERRAGLIRTPQVAAVVAREAGVDIQLNPKPRAQSPLLSLEHGRPFSDRESILYQPGREEWPP